MRPFIHINCASSLDGRIAMSGGRRVTLSSPWDKRRVHLLRKRYGALLVGIGTILQDDPKLHINPEHTGGSGGPLTRIILDSHLRTPVNARLFSYPGEVLIYTLEGVANSVKSDFLERVKVVEGYTVRVVEVGGTRWGVNLLEVLSDLKRRGIEHILVEGGGSVIESFLRQGLFDLMTIFLRPTVIGGRDAPSLAFHPLGGEEAVDLSVEKVEVVEGGLLLTLFPKGRRAPHSLSSPQ